MHSISSVSPIGVVEKYEIPNGWLVVVYRQWFLAHVHCKVPTSGIMHYS